MSEAFRCFHCSGVGRLHDEDAEPGDRGVECPRCKGSGGLNLRCVGPGVPKSDDPYVPVPKGVNW